VITLTVRGDEIEGDLVQQMRGRVRRISLQREKS
jgi:hypothetical protein